MYWCNGGGNGGGQNKLGVLLMRVRSQLREVVQQDKYDAVAGGVKLSSTVSTPSNTIVMKSGDLLAATEQYIAHQCNCVSTYPKGR